MDNQGSILAYNDALLDLDADMTNSGLIQANSIILDTNDLTHSGTLYSNVMHLNLGDLVQSGYLISLTNLIITANAFENSTNAQTYAGNQLNLKANEFENNGVLTVNDDLDIISSEVLNSGDIYVAGSAHFPSSTGTDLTFENAGQVTVDATTTVSAYSFDNSGSWLSGESFNGSMDEASNSGQVRFIGMVIFHRLRSIIQVISLYLEIPH